MTGDAFAAWKVAEFIQQLVGNKKTLIPPDWQKRGNRPLQEITSIRSTRVTDGYYLDCRKGTRNISVSTMKSSNATSEEDEDTDVDVLRDP